MEKLLTDNLTSIVQSAEQKVDEEIERLQNLGTDELEQLREERMRKLKRDREQKMEWKAIGHGEYTEIPEERQVFDVVRRSKNVVCHFYRESMPRCRIVDKHLQLLAPQHLEARFCKMDAEKCPFLAKKLHVAVLPCVLLFQDAIVVDRIVGFTELGNCDDFTTEMMEWRLAQKDVIRYVGDKAVPPNEKRKTAASVVSLHRANLRDGGGTAESDSSEDEEFQQLGGISDGKGETVSNSGDNGPSRRSRFADMTDEELAAIEAEFGLLP